MKKIGWLLVTGMCIVAMACSGGQNSGNGGDADTTAIDSGNVEVFTYDSIAIEKNDTAIETSIRVDYPTGGPRELVDSIMKFIAEELHVAPEVVKDREHLLGKAIETGRETLLENREEQLADMGADTPTYSFSYTIKVEADTEEYVTYTVGYYEYQGGAHGGYVLTGTTFYKADGHRLTWDSFKDTSSKAFQKILKEGLYDYFGEYSDKPMTDEELKDNLIAVDDINKIPRPQFAPYFVPRGMVFTYQQYEIAAYAAGLPSFIVPYKKISTFLKKP